jgi:hypothetical protein
MKFFALKRTNGKNEHKFMGVETPSQVRFVKYFERIIKELDFKVPTPKALHLDKIVMHSINGIFKLN